MVCPALAQLLQQELPLPTFQRRQYLRMHDQDVGHSTGQGMQEQHGIWPAGAYPLRDVGAEGLLVAVIQLLGVVMGRLLCAHVVDSPA